VNRSVLVTGAAHGIGRATAELFARQGWSVGLYDVDADGVQQVRAGLTGCTTVGGHLDVTDADGWRAALVELTARTGGVLDVLVNNAGVLTSGPLAEVPLPLQRRVVDVNVTGVVTGCASAFPHLRRGSVVVNLASASALYGQPGLATYSATKAAVCALTEALDLEWEAHGIRVVDVLPLFVETGMVEGLRGSRSVQRLGIRLTPEDVAAAVRVAVDDRSRRPGRTVPSAARRGCSPPPPSSARSGCAGRWPAGSAGDDHTHPLTPRRDDVTVVQLPTPPGLGPASDRHLAGLEQRLGLRAAVCQPGQLEQLAEPDAGLALAQGDLDVAHRLSHGAIVPRAGYGRTTVTVAVPTLLSKT
jgi:NAD(P)-dependent dehydrogenase (short-subunit alcohol dehydrogenase family)